MTAHKTNRHAKRGRRPRAPKEGATFDTELQRYVMQSERVTMSKQSEKCDCVQGILERTNLSQSPRDCTGMRYY